MNKYNKFWGFFEWEENVVWTELPKRDLKIGAGSCLEMSKKMITKGRSVKLKSGTNSVGSFHSHLLQPTCQTAPQQLWLYLVMPQLLLLEWMNECISNSKRKPGLQCHTAADSVLWNCCIDTWVSELEACETTAVRDTVKNTSSVALLQLFPIYTWTVGQRWDITGQDRWQSCFFDLWKETFSLVEVRLFWFMVIAK